MKFPESALAHRLLDGKRGVEVGPSAHNPFGLNTVNVGRSTDGTVFAEEEAKLCGEVAKLHFICEANDLPFKDATCDFVISSHVLEHCYDLIGTIKEWLRVVKPDGFVYVIFPHKERTFDKERPRTPLSELKERQGKSIAQDGHHTVWVTADAIELCADQGWKVVEQQDADDKVGNGFTFVIQKCTSLS